MQASVEAEGFRARRLRSAALALLLPLYLTGCSSVPDAVNPISWYRDLTGASKNDDVGDKRNQKNLDAGGQQPYPNLADVPEAPDSAMSTIDRDALKDSLVADRENAKYSDDQLRAGREIPGAPPPPPPEANGPAKSPPAEAATASASAAPSAGGSPSPPAAPPAAAPAPSGPSAAPAMPQVVAAATPTAPAAAPSPAAPASASAAAVPQNASPPRPAAPPAAKSEAPPDESPLTSPTVAQLPQGETPEAPPPPPQIPPPLPPVAPGSRPVASPSSPAAPPPDQAAASPARLKPPPPQQQAALPPAAGLRRGPAISYQVADIAFGDGSASLPAAASDTVAEIAKLYGENGGTIRVVGHGEAASGADAAMNGFTLALDRAQAVAAALTGAGIPAKNITVETAPARGGGGRDVPRAEIYLEK